MKQPTFNDLAEMRALIAHHKSALRPIVVHMGVGGLRYNGVCDFPSTACSHFMQFIVKYFTEITIKSRPVRKRMSAQLRDNLKRLLKPVLTPEGIEFSVVREWDKIVVTVNSDDLAIAQAISGRLRDTPGIAYFNQVEEHDFDDLEGLYPHVRTVFAERLANKSFCVRTKRIGSHDFTSQDADTYFGGRLLADSAASGVNLSAPDETVRIEIRDQTAYLATTHARGLGGFPIGSVDSVVSLISGGFDSSVSSYQMMRRGLHTHFVFFNLGGREHELAVKEVAWYLWNRYGASHRVKFVTVPFEPVVAELITNVSDAYMGVLLKRMMLRAASAVGESLGAGALVTGEAIAQVSSQTLANLQQIDSCTSTLVLRPLIGTDKMDIVDTAAAIGTKTFAEQIPEYCGVISVSPTTKAKPERVEQEEARFDMSLLERALAQASYENIDELGELDVNENAAIETLMAPLPGAVVLDVRHPGEVRQRPVKLSNVEVQQLPFFKVQSGFARLDQTKKYMLYCEQGVMSRLQAAHLQALGYSNVSVYRPPS